LTLTFELGRDFCTVHPTAKFRHPTFNRSEVIVLTNKQADDAETPTSLGSAMLRRWVKINNILMHDSFYPMRILPRPVFLGVGYLFIC